MPEPVIKVSRDGSVTRDGTIIGSIKKIDPTDPLHIRGEGVGMRVSFSLKPQWYAYSTEGTQLNEIGYDTRKRALSRVDNASKPIEVTDVTTETYFSGMGGDGREFTRASITWQGNWASISRYPGERAWVMDSYAPEGAFMPQFSNGAGTRYTRPHVLQGELHNAANAAAVSAGLLAPEEAVEWDELVRVAQAEIDAEKTAAE